MNNYIAKYDSFGFRNRYWEKNEIAVNVSIEEEKSDILKHFSKISNNEIKDISNEIVDDLKEGLEDAKNEIVDDLIILRNDYLIKFGVEVSNRYKNDIVWIKNKLKEEANNGKDNI
jgi:hypothetical protein